MQEQTCKAVLSRSCVASSWAARAGVGVSVCRRVARDCTALATGEGACRETPSLNCLPSMGIEYVDEFLLCRRLFCRSPRLHGVMFPSLSELHATPAQGRRWEL